jgi:predicted acyltransferase
MADQQRYLALDVFRGMTICFMIIVNSPGDWNATYGPLLHAPWHGFTLTDLIFPSFLFAVGNAMAFVMHKFETQPHAIFWQKIIKRTVIIFLLGLFLSGFPFFDITENGIQFISLSEFRIMNVLQRIALCYFFASVVVHFGSKTFVVWFSAFALVAYWFISYFFGDPSDPYSLAGNAGLKLDLVILGASHLYQGEGIPFDPEGLLSTLPAIVNVIAGYLAGDFIRKNGNTYETIAKLLIAGAVLCGIALAWDIVFPINKKIWTSSYVLYTVGLDLFILSILIYVIEIYNSQRWTYFFVVFGRNPLFIYVMAWVIMATIYAIPGGYGFLGWYYNSFLGSFANPVNASLLYALTYMMINWLIGYYLDRKKIYIKV